MGAIASKLPCSMPSLPSIKLIPEQDRIERRLKELVEVYTEEYLKAYKSVLIAHIRAKHNPSEEKEARELFLDPKSLIPPVQMEGYVLKAKDLKSQDFSKKVYWVINNEYIVKEYKDKPESADAKADKEYNFHMYYCYRGEEKSHWTLELTHNRATREQLKVAFEDENEGYKWRGLLELARYRTEGPLNPDPILAEAFPIAINETRWRCWVWANWYLDGTEGEIIGDCFFSVLEQEIMYDAFGKLPDGPKKTAYTAVKKIIDSAATAGWKAILNAAGPAKAVVEKAAAEALDPIFKAEADIKNKIIQAVKDAVGPALQSVQPKIDEQVGKAIPALAQAGNDEMDLYIASMAEAAKSGDVKKGLQTEMWNNSWYWWGRNRVVSNNIYDNIYLAHRDSSSWVWWRLAWDLIEEWRNVNQFAFKVAQNEIDAGQDFKSQIYPSVYRRFAHDIHLVTLNAFIKAIDSSIRDDVMKVVHKGLTPILEPVQELIPDAIKDVINPRRTANEIINEVLRNTEETIARSALNKFHEQLQAKVASLPAL